MDPIYLLYIIHYFTSYWVLCLYVCIVYQWGYRTFVYCLFCPFLMKFTVIFSLWLWYFFTFLISHFLKYNSHFEVHNKSFPTVYIISFLNVTLAIMIFQRLMVLKHSEYLQWGCRGKAGTESQNYWGWKGPLEVISSNLLAQAGPPEANCPGPHPDDLQPPLATCTSAWSSSQKKKTNPKQNTCFPMFRGNLLYFSFCPLPLVPSLGITASQQNQQGEQELELVSRSNQEDKL